MLTIHANKEITVALSFNCYDELHAFQLGLLDTMRAAQGSTMKDSIDMGAALDALQATLLTVEQFNELQPTPPRASQAA